jgi:hypothetical protein
MPMVVTVVTLNLIINNSSASSVDVTACDDFMWDGIVYDLTGSYTNIYVDANGCDSTVTLNLTINNSYTGSLDVTECDDFIWDGVVYDSTGSYTNVYVGANGCDSTVTLNLIINEAAVIEILYNSSSGTLTANNISGSLSPYSWLWNTGELAQTIAIDTSALYWCVVSDANGCLSDTAYFSLPTGIDDISASRLLIYPNPIVDVLNIKFEYKNNQSVELKIVNILGEVMYFEKVNQSELSYFNKFDFSKFSKGLYFVKLKLDKNIITKKVVLQ